MLIRRLPPLPARGRSIRSWLDSWSVRRTHLRVRLLLLLLLRCAAFRFPCPGQMLSRSGNSVESVGAVLFALLKRLVLERWRKRPMLH